MRIKQADKLDGDLAPPRPPVVFLVIPLVPAVTTVVSPRGVTPTIGCAVTRVNKHLGLGAVPSLSPATAPSADTACNETWCQLLKWCDGAKCEIKIKDPQLVGLLTKHSSCLGEFQQNREPCLNEKMYITLYWVLSRSRFARWHSIALRTAVLGKSADMTFYLVILSHDMSHLVAGHLPHLYQAAVEARHLSPVPCHLDMINLWLSSLNTDLFKFKYLHFHL